MVEERMELRIGAPVIAGDGAYGRLEQIMIDQPSRQVTGLVVRKNPFADDAQIVPVEEITDASDEEIRVQLNGAEIASLPRSNDRDEALHAGQSVRTTDGHTGYIIDLLVTPGGNVRDLVVNTGGLKGHEVILPVKAVSNGGDLTVPLKVNSRELEAMTLYRLDLDIEADVVAVLWNDSMMRELEQFYMDSIVRDGIAILSGHVSTLTIKSRAEALAANVRGVLRVENHLVADDELRIRVAQAVFQNPPLSNESIRVACQHGYVVLSGAVSSAGVSQMAEERAARVPYVRGVLNYLRVPDIEHDEQTLRALQPRIGQDVFTADLLPLGHVIQVIVNPRNRLVIGIVVESKDDQPLIHPKNQTASRQIIFPLRHIELVTVGGVFLNVSLQHTVWADAFDESDFDTPPADWTPPYPYRTGNIVFSRIER